MECASGEIDRRWGIFWRRLEGKLEEHRFIIDGCLRLHNFIVDFREANKDIDHTELENELDVTCDEFIAKNPLAAVGIMNEEMGKEKKRK